PGAYVFSLRLAERSGNTLTISSSISVRRAFEVGSGDVEMDVTPSPGLSVAASVAGLPDGWRGAIRLEPTDPGDPSLETGYRADVDNRFSFERILPDRYFVRISAPEGHYLRSIRLGKDELPSQLMDLTPTSGALELRLAADGGKIAGSTLDAEDR